MPIGTLWCSYLCNANDLFGMRCIHMTRPAGQIVSSSIINAYRLAPIVSLYWVFAYASTFSLVLRVDNPRSLPQQAFQSQYYYDILQPCVKMQQKRYVSLLADLSCSSALLVKLQNVQIDQPNSGCCASDTSRTEKQYRQPCLT